MRHSVGSRAKVRLQVNIYRKHNLMLKLILIVNCDISRCFQYVFLAASLYILAALWERIRHCKSRKRVTYNK
jgi:hypothetical protein